MARILPFERHFDARAAGRVVVVIAEKSGDADSKSASKRLSRELEHIGTVGKRPISIHTTTYSSAGALAKECKKRGAVAAYLTPGFAGEMGAISAAFKGSGVLSVAAVEGYVPKGAVLGIAVVDGKPRMSINLAQAKAQKLDFPSAVLKLARIY